MIQNRDSLLDELCGAVDAMDADKFLSFIAEDGVFRFASAPQVVRTTSSSMAR